ncbi:LysM peptidoglycan-binding domain-containing protein [Arthrobacter sp. D1-17]
MSRKSMSARHRATPTQSIALEGLSHSLKSNAASLARPAAAVAAASGLVFGVGAPAMAGANAPETSGSAGVQAQAATHAPAPAAPAASGATHTVVPGDTLGAIAAKHGVALNAVLSANGLSLSSVIYPGDQIVIPGAAHAAPAPQAAAPAAPHAAPAAPAAPHAAPAAPQQQAGMGIYHASASIKPASATTAASSTPASGVGGALVASARAQLGATQDCTILVEQALRSVGKQVGDLAPTQFHQYGTPVSNPQPGDLMISSGHVAIYIGDGQAISSGMNGVNETIVHPASWLGGSSYVRVA